MVHDFKNEITDEHVLQVVKQARAQPQENPWRTAFWVMTGFVCLISIVLIFVGISLKVIIDDRKAESESDACYDEFVNISSQAIREVRATGTRVNNYGWAALIRSANGEDVDVDATIDELDTLIDASESALVDDQRAIEARDAWVTEGRPMPDGKCPASN